jgi:quinol-cytochrome oxidoreductase complex cytochrome b subunit
MRWNGNGIQVLVPGSVRSVAIVPALFAGGAGLGGVVDRVFGAKIVILGYVILRILFARIAALRCQVIRAFGD